MAPQDEAGRRADLSELVTARLRGASPRRSDLDALAGLLADERVDDSVGGPLARDQADAALRDDVEHWRAYGFGRWLLWLQEDGAFAGRAGLRRTEVDGRPEVELGWLIVPDRWDQGLGTEAGAAAAALAFEQLGLASVVALIAEDDAPSQSVADRLGMQREADISRDGRPTRLYRLSP
jgi:RimJ/RimL family protein N-acetyltransferase